MRNGTLIAVLLALVVLEVVVSAWWLHLFVMVGIALVVFPLARDFARSQS